jgi:RNA-directed DNA polymerase
MFWPETRIACLTRGAEGLRLPGFTHRKRESAKWQGRWYLQKWPSAWEMTSVRGKIRARTTCSQSHRSLNAVIAELNPILRGWGAYFRYGNSSRKFASVDQFLPASGVELVKVRPIGQSHPKLLTH